MKKLMMALSIAVMLVLSGCACKDKRSSKAPVKKAAPHKAAAKKKVVRKAAPKAPAKKATHKATAKKKSTYAQVTLENTPATNHIEELVA